MADDEKTPLSNEEAKKKIFAGEVLKGLHIDRLTLNKKEFDVVIEIEECTIGTLDLNKSTFNEEVLIRRCNIDVLVLSEAHFKKKCNFKKSKVGRGRIQKAKFSGAANFDSASLAYTSFHQSVFEDTVTFNYGRFHGDATFNQVVFHKDAKFNSVYFQMSGVFPETEWHGKADFRQTECESNFDFLKAKFHQDLLFNGAVIRLSLMLNQSYLGGHTNFTNIMTGRILSLNKATLGEEQGFHFTNATAPSIVLERDTVEGHIFPERHGKYDLAAKEYAFLRTTFANINRFQDEDWAYYQFKRMSRMGKPLSMNPLALFKRAFDYLFLDIGCGYGTKPFRTLAVGGVLILCFSIIYFLTGTYGSEIIDFGLGPVNNFFNSVNISLVAFSGGYGDLDIKGPIRLLAMLEYLIGVVFMGLFVVAFSRKVIR